MEPLLSPAPQGLQPGLSEAGSQQGKQPLLCGFNERFPGRAELSASPALHNEQQRWPIAGGSGSRG